MAYDKEILNVAHARGAKGNRRETLLASTILAMASALMAPGLISPALAQVALPSNGQVVSGQATIETPTDSSVRITQSSDKAIIDWTNFSIGQGGSVRFDNGTGATLNRVTGTSLSSINGVLSATGSVYLINPNGVIIGQSGVVNVGGNFVASTLNVSNADFMKGGSLTFDGLSGASIINFGKVGSLGGDVALIANTVDNRGEISASKGTVGLIAGQSVLMRDASVDGGKFLILRGGAGSSVSHSGLISATAAELAAEGGSVYALAGNTDHIERATDVIESDGKVYLATGAKSGGDIAVGADALIDVSSTTGDGGSAKIIADMATGHLTFQGRALARGGYGFKGGFVETSGAYVNFNGARVDTTAEGGKTGLWLTDPYDLTVDATAASTISSNLATTNVTLQTTASGSSGPGTPNAGGNGDITINSAISWSSGNMLTLDAYRGININAGITVAGAGGVTLITNNGGSGGDYSFGLSNTGFAGKLSFTGTPNSGQSLTINGDNYNLLYSMGDIAGISGSSDRYALANDLSGGSHSDAVVGTFGGNFTGLGHTVSNLTINATATNAAGLIGENTGTVRDLGLTGGTITGAASSGNTGALIGVNYGAVKNAYSTATVSSGGNDVGGLIGKSDNGTVSNVFATGSVSGNNTVGGLIGYTSSGSVSDAHATGTVTQLSNNINTGGLIGSASGTSITNVYATGDVVSLSGGAAVGGLVGAAQSGATIDKAYATGAVNGSDHIGGLVGLLDSATVSNSHASGSVDGNFRLGGLVGTAENSTLSTSYANGNVTSANVGGDMYGGFVGKLVGSTVTDAYATGSVNAPGSNNAVGGFVGYLDTGSSISQAYALGFVNVGAPSGNVGGFTGQAISGSSVSNAYYDYQTTGQAAGVQADGTEGLSTTALQGTLPGGFSNSVWGTAAGYYPYFQSSAPTQKVSGFAYNNNGSAAVGATVGVYKAGNLLTGGTVSTGANGYYYYTVALGTATSTTPLGAALTLSGDTNASGLSYTDTPTVTGVDVTDLNITSGIFDIRTTQTSYSTLLNNMTATFGSGNHSSLVSGLGTAERRIFAATSFDIDQSISTTGKLLIQANDGNLSIGSGASVQSSASGDAVVLAANGSFTNNGGASSVVASNGRWLIYSQAHNAPSSLPTFAVTGGLNGKSYYNDAFNFGTSSFASAAGAGNRFVYGYAPTLTVSPTTQSLVYNGAAQTDTYAASGYLNAGDQTADSLTGTISGLTTGSKNVGAYSLTASGTLASDLNYAITYGTGTLTITPATLTASLTGNTTKTYDGNTSASLTGITYGLSGAFGTDDVSASGTSAAYGNKNAGTGKSVTVAGMSLSGTDAGNYVVAGTASGNIGAIDKAALTLSAVTDTKTYNSSTASSGVVGVSGLVGGDTVTGLTQTFDSKNAGSRTLSVTGYTLSDGNAGGNYDVTLQTASGTIGKASLTLSAVTDTKTYNGSTASTGVVGVAGLQGLDTVTGKTQSFDSKNAGPRTLNVTGYTVNDGNAGGNYDVTLQTAAGTINKASLTIAATTETKVYDGTITSTAAPTTAGLASGDTVTGLTQAFDSKDAGPRTITVSGTYTINDGNGGNNYNVTTGALSIAGSITPKSLTASLTGNTTKTYDGTLSAGLTGINYALLGIIGTDNVSASGTSAAYGDKNAGSGKSVTASGLSLSGTDAANYSVSTTASGNIGTIGKAALTLTAATDTKTYNGTTASSGVVGVSGLASGDSVTGLTQTFNSKNAGSRTLNVTGYTVNDGNAGGNYTVTLASAAGTINKAALTASLTGTTTKVYDGALTSSLTSGNYTLTGAVSGDAVTVSGTAAYTNKDAGAGKTVTASGLTLAGIDAGNYTVNASASANIGTITKAALTASLTGTTTKTYDGTTTATLAGANYALTGVVSGEAVSVSGASATYNNKNAGTGKTVTASGLSLSGTDAGNYTVSGTATGNIGTINKAALTLTATTATKTYNGTTAATGTATVSGIVAGDTVTGVTQAFDSKNAGTRTVNVTAYTVNDGNAGGNYTVTLASAAGTINKAALTAALTGTTTKTYDGTTSATLAASNYALTGLVSGDAVTVSGTATYADKNAGTTKAVTSTGLTLGGTDGGNYTVNASATANIGTITKAALTIKADPKSKVQGVSDPALTYSVTSGTLFSGDSLTGALTRAVGENPGTYDITQGTLAASSNYTLTYVKGSFNITPLMLLTTLTLTPATGVEGLQLPETEAPEGASPCVSSDKCLSHPYPTNQVISSTIRFASK